MYKSTQKLIKAYKSIQKLITNLQKHIKASESLRTNTKAYNRTQQLTIAAGFWRQLAPMVIVRFIRLLYASPLTFGGKISVQRASEHKNWLERLLDSTNISLVFLQTTQANESHKHAER